MRKQNYFSCVADCDTTRAEVATHRIATKYALLLFVQTLATLLLNSFYERKVCIALSTNDTRIIPIIGKIYLISLILTVVHICNNTHIIMLLMDYDMLSILFCLEIFGSCRHELDNIIFSFHRRFVLGTIDWKISLIFRIIESICLLKHWKICAEHDKGYIHLIHNVPSHT